jgi:diguanylate cyclase (GGDEF)-like protein
MGSTSTVEGVCARLARDSSWDRLLTRLWPSSRGEESFETYCDQIASLFRTRSVLLTGFVTTLIVLATATCYDQYGFLTPGILFVYVPAFLLRYGFAALYAKTLSTHPITNPHRDEARYVASSTITTLAMAGLFSYCMFTFDLMPRLAIALGIVTLIAITAARSSYIPLLTLVQAYLFIVPAGLGLLVTGELFATTMGLALFAYLYYLQIAIRSFRANVLEALRQSRAAHKIANFDTVTSLPNRYMFGVELARRLSASDSRDFSILALDFDQFKQVNDSRGHSAGDELLKLAAERLVAQAHRFDPTALVARIGGDEFIILAKQGDQQIASEIIEAFREHFPLVSGPVIIGISIGICRASETATASDLLQKADTALYAAKEQGRNRCVLFTPDMEKRANDRDHLEQKFRRALAAGSLTLAYQPIVQIETSEVAAVEALARWTDNEFGVVAPPRFIEIAEQTGQIDILFEVLLEKACSAAMTWPNHVRLAFNVSPNQFLNPDSLVTSVASTLGKTGLDPARLELEITEGVMIQDFDAVRTTLERVTALGVKIALDDFGSGFCSLSYLHQIGFDKIKIDRSLAMAAVASKSQAIVISMIVRLADALSAQVVVEGVEDEGTALQMRSLGVRLAQGYFYGRPQTASELARRYFTRPESPIAAVA